jgi:hypothetical protein
MGEIINLARRLQMNRTKTLTRLIAGTALAAAAMTALAAPANAGVSVGIGIGIPGLAPVAPPPPPPGGRWCYYHPGACGAYGPGPGFVPVVGTFYAGRGWWDGHAWYHDRFRFHGGWRYR